MITVACPGYRSYDAPMTDVVSQLRSLVDSVQDDPSAVRAVAIAALEDNDTSDVLAHAHWALGLAARELHDLDEADRRLHLAVEAARVGGLPALEGEILISQALVLAYRGDVDAGISALDRADLLVEGAAAARSLKQRGLILTRMGRLDEALEAYGRALPVIRAGRDETAEVRLLLNRSVVYMWQGADRAAIDDLEVALSIARRRGQSLQVAACAQNLGLRAGAARGGADGTRPVRRGRGGVSATRRRIRSCRRRSQGSCGGPGRGRSGGRRPGRRDRCGRDARTGRQRDGRRGGPPHRCAAGCRGRRPISITRRRLGGGEGLRGSAPPGLGVARRPGGVCRHGRPRAGNTRITERDWRRIWSAGGGCSKLRKRAERRQSGHPRRRHRRGPRIARDWPDRPPPAQSNESRRIRRGPWRSPRRSTPEAPEPKSAVGSRSWTGTGRPSGRSSCGHGSQLERAT